MESIKNLKILSDVVDAGWIDTETLCQGVPAGTVDSIHGVGRSVGRDVDVAVCGVAV